MLTTNKPFGAFDRPQKPLRFVSVYSVLNVFAVGNKFQIFQAVITSVKIFMVNFKTTFDRAYKRLPQCAVDRNKSVFSPLTQTYSLIVLVIPDFNRSVRFIPPPSFAVFNGEYGGYAGVQERRHIRQFTPVIQHLFSFNNLFRRKSFTPRYAAHISQIADFVQRFVTKHWLPVFHNMPHLTYMQSNCIYVEGQA